jgi:very-short-patch-repair endonuclease
VSNKIVNERSHAHIVRVAGRQHGVITTQQLIAGGMSRTTITAWTKWGRLHRLHRGVYAVGHRGLARQGFWMAAVLAGGPGAVLSHLQAAYLWRLLEPKPGPVHITVSPTGGRAQRQDLVIHRAALPSGQTTIRARIPVTRPERTLSDLRRVAGASTYRQALRQAEYLGLPTGEHLPDGTRSELEARFLALCRRHRLPEPEVNVRLGPFLVDCLWAAERLVVELDGYAAHGGRTSFERDRARDAELTRMGYRMLRFTWHQVAREPGAVAAAIRAVIRA